MPTLYIRSRTDSEGTMYLYGSLMVLFYGTDPEPFTSYLPTVWPENTDRDNEQFWLSELSN